MKKLTSVVFTALWLYVLMHAVAGLVLMTHDAFAAFLDWKNRK